MKKIILLLVFPILGCVLIAFTQTKIINLSSTWQLDKSTTGYVILKNDIFSNINVRIDFSQILYGYGLNSESCQGKYQYKNVNYIIDVEVSNNQKETNFKYFFNPSLIYFKQNNQIYKFQAYDMFDRNFDAPDKLYNVTNLLQDKGKILASYKSPLICGELENAEFVMDVLAISKGDNTQPIPLAPIKLRFNFDNPESIPLYEK